MYPESPTLKRRPLHASGLKTLSYTKESMETVVVFSFTLEGDKDQAKDAVQTLKNLLQTKYEDRFSTVNEVYMERNEFESEVGKAALKILDRAEETD